MSKKGGFADLVAARRSGVRMTSKLEERLADAPSMFEELTEDQYRKRVEDRRKLSRFVVGKNTLGYEDDGEDRFSQGSYSEEEEEEEGGKGKGAAKAAPAPVVQQRVNAPAAAAAPKPPVSQAARPVASAPIAQKSVDLEAMLGELNDDEEEGSTSHANPYAAISAAYGSSAAAATSPSAPQHRRAVGASIAPLGGAGTGLNPFARGGATRVTHAPRGEGGSGSGSGSGLAHEGGEEGGMSLEGAHGEEAMEGLDEEEEEGKGEGGVGGMEDFLQASSSSSSSSAGAGAGAGGASGAGGGEAKSKASLALKMAASKRKSLVVEPVAPSQGGGAGGAGGGGPRTLTGMSAAAAAAAAAEALDVATSAPVQSIVDASLGGGAGAGAGGGGVGVGGASTAAPTNSLAPARRTLAFESIQDRSGKPAPTTLFYWIDAYEDQWRAPGVVHVFGKVMVNEAAVLSALRHNARLEALKSRRAAATATAAAAAAAGEGGGDVDESELTGASLDHHAPKPIPEPQYTAACLTITGFQRCLFVLPRERAARSGEVVHPSDVQAEMREVLKGGPCRGPGNAILMKAVTRNYAFELSGVPRTNATYVKLLYSASLPSLPSDLSGNTFSRVFGATTTPMEHFLLKRKLKGPCWLRVAGVVNHPAPVSHCTVDLLVEDPKSVSVYGALPATPQQQQQAAAAATHPALRAPHERSVYGEHTLPLPTPDLVVMSLSLKTQVAPRTHAHEVVAASLVVHRTVNSDTPSANETRGATMTQTLIRPLTGSTGLPPDLRALVTKGGHPIKVMHDERALLTVLLAHMERFDPDVLCGHNIAGFDLDILLHRFNFHKIHGWSKLGRLKRSAFPRTSPGVGGRETFTGVTTAGRLVCDTYLAARELLNKETTYRLTELAASLLSTPRTDIDPLDVPRHMKTGADCVRLARHTDNDAWLAMALMFKLQVLPLTKQLTSLAGNLWSRSLKGARAERIEYLLLHEFHRLKYVCPDKERFSDGKKEVEEEEGGEEEGEEEGGGGGGGGGKRGGKSKGKRTATGTGTAARAAKGRQKPSYSGGLVLEPKKGLYDKFVLLLDFNSLYPSIIQEYNICFTTVERPLRLTMSSAAVAAAPAPSKGKGGKKKREGGGGGGEGEEGGDAPPAAPQEEEEEEEEEEGGAPSIPPLPDASRHTELAVLPRVIRNLVMERRKVKSAAKSEKDGAKLASLDIRQKALKILANSMYGCLGFGSSRFYAKPIAALVTSQGRDILQSTVDLATTALGLEVIYGDTDSVMIHTASTDLRAVKEMGRKMMVEVNKKYKCLEIDIDGIFSMMLLLKKKKYAALKIHEEPGGVLRETREVKGLDMVRRDWCVLSKNLGERVLECIMAPIKEEREADRVVQNVHTLLASTAADMRSAKLPLEGYVITKGLNKAPQDYPDAKGQPHLQVALAMLKQGKTVNVGDHVPYVICLEAVGSVDLTGGAAAASGGAPTTATTASGEEGGASSSSSSSSSSAASSPPTAAAAAVEEEEEAGKGKKKDTKASAAPLAQRAWHPDEVRKSNGVLHVDVEWYLSQQILPPVTRMCEVIEGTSPARIAEVLGLDASRFSGRVGGMRDFNREDEMGFTPRHLLPDEERYRGAEPLPVKCLRCGTEGAFPGALVLYNGVMASKGGPGGSPEVPMPSSSSSSSSAAAAGGGGMVAVAPTMSYRSGLYCTKVGCGGLWGCRDTPRPTTPLSAVEETKACAVQLSNLLTLTLRRHVYTYNAGWLQCEDALCSTRTRSQGIHKGGRACPRPGCNSLLWPEKEPSALHMQLEYLNSLVNVEAAWLKRSRFAKAALDAAEESRTLPPSLPTLPKLPRKGEDAPLLPYNHYHILSNILHTQVASLLAQCAYHFVPIAPMLSYVHRMNARNGLKLEPPTGLRIKDSSGSGSGRLGGGGVGGMGMGSGGGSRVYGGSSSPLAPPALKDQIQTPAAAGSSLVSLGSLYSVAWNPAGGSGGGGGGGGGYSAPTKASFGGGGKRGRVGGGEDGFLGLEVEE